MESKDIYKAKDYRHAMNQPVEKTVETTTTETEAVVETVIGVVTECVKLNIRKEPSKDADILCEVKFASELQVDLTKSTDDWYSVCTGAGIEGFCMKEYVNIGM